MLKKGFPLLSIGVVFPCIFISQYYTLVTILMNPKTNPIKIGTITILTNNAQLIALFAIETFSPHNPIATFCFRFKLYYTV